MIGETCCQLRLKKSLRKHYVQKDGVSVCGFLYLDERASRLESGEPLIVFFKAVCL